MTIKVGGDAATSDELATLRSDLELVSGGVPEVRNSDDPYYPGTARKAELRGKYTTPLHPDTSKFGFATVVGDGATYYAVDFDNGDYNSGITGVLERADDSSFIGDGTAKAPAANEYAWKLVVTPTDTVTVGRPRTQLRSFPLENFKTYRVELKFRFDQASVWNRRDYDLYSGGLMFLTNLGTDDYGANQNATSGPFTLMCTGSRLYPLFRTIEPEMGADPAGTYSTIDWGFGDTYAHIYRVPPRTPCGIDYQYIRIEMHLDWRQHKDGGRGFIKGWWNHEPWFDHQGATIYPPMADTGVLDTFFVQVGLYDTSYGTATAGTLNNDTDAPPNGVGTSAFVNARSIWVNGFRIMEIT